MKRYLRESLKHFPEVLKVADEIKSSGIVIGIVSNHASEWFEDIAARFGFYDVFPREYTIVSQAVRAAKPDAKILDILMERITRDHGQIHRHEVC
jgi:FMN phosphatase YigB (HAD superfamily)